MEYIIIGGGYAGMIAAINLKSVNNKVTIIEKNNSLGKKLLVTGNRRCNITNNKDNNQLINLIYNGKFLYSALSECDVNTIINFYKQLDLDLIEEEDNRMYPATQKASDVLKVLENRIKELNINVIYNTEINKINIQDNIIMSIESNNKQYTADKYIFSTGGVSFKKLGSDGLIHKVLSKNSIDITKLYPVEAPLYSNDKVIKSKELVGLSYKDVSLKITKLNKEFIDDLIFTHKGISGPAPLRACEYVYHLLLKEKEVEVSINFIRSLNAEKLKAHLLNFPNKKLYDFLNSYLYKRHIDYIFDNLNLSKSLINSQLSNKKFNELIDYLFKFKININNTEKVERATITGGGVDLKQINPYDFSHKDISNLYICGELLDLHGPIGGYNLTIAFISAYTTSTRLKKLE